MTDPTLKANDQQVGGDHYRQLAAAEGEQHWDRMWRLHGRGYFIGQITRYVERYHLKNGLQDLAKATHYIQKLTELEKAWLDGTGPPPGETGNNPLPKWTNGMDNALGVVLEEARKQYDSMSMVRIQAPSVAGYEEVLKKIQHLVDVRFAGDRFRAFCNYTGTSRLMNEVDLCNLLADAEAFTKVSRMMWARYIVKTLDKDNDGAISWDELKESWESADEVVELMKRPTE